jgi:hypothetical protein
MIGGTCIRGMPDGAHRFCRQFLTEKSTVPKLLRPTLRHMYLGSLLLVVSSGHICNVLLIMFYAVSLYHRTGSADHHHHVRFNFCQQ